MCLEMGRLDLQCSSRNESGVAIVTLSGKLDAASVSGFREVVGDLYQAGQRRFVLDLTDCDLVDGHGLAGLMVFYRRLTGNTQGRLALAGLNPEVRQFLDRTSLSRVLAIGYDWREAVREVKGS